MPQNGPPFLITEDEPTPLVSDLDVFLDAVAKPSAYLTKARQTLDRATLYAANQAMQTEQTEAHPRTDQRYYPLLNFLQRLCMAGRFHVLGYHKGKLRMLPTERAADVRALAPAAKYLALLEAFWADCDWAGLSIVQRPYAFLDGEDSAGDAVMQLAGFPADSDVPFESLRHGGRFRFGLHLHAVIPTLSFFGFLAYTTSPPGEIYLPKGVMRVRSVTLSALGKAFLATLHNERPLRLWNLPSRKKWDVDQERFAGKSVEPGDGGVTEPTPFWEPFVPLLAPGSFTTGLSRPTRERKEQTFVFRVSLGNVWRTIALSDEHTLHALHLAIQLAFDFDDDHLYAFYMDGKRYSDNAYNDPRASGEGPYADDVAFGELDLYVRQRILYLFDFGDNWEFGVELIETRDEPHEGEPKILEEKGEAPQQYKNWDDEEW